MEKKNDRYDNKCIRFYDKTDHYELWFMDDFNLPGSGKMWEGGSEYTLICDIVEELFNGDPNKELHIFIWSMGGAVDTLSTLLQGISRYRRTIAVNLGVADSAGWMLFFSCDERYASRHSEFMYHGVSLFTFGKVEETAATVEYTKRRVIEIHTENENITKYLTPEEIKLSESTQVWFTGSELILRGACEDYDKYFRRISPKPMPNEFFTFDNRIYRYHCGFMQEYKPIKNQYIEDSKLLSFTKDEITSTEDLTSCELILNNLLKDVKAAKQSPNKNNISQEHTNMLLSLLNRRR